MSEKKLTMGIVTISFNQAKYLPQAVTSVRIADPARLRYVIVDPGSEDGSRDYIRRFSDCFTAMVLEPDAGPADGLNKGFAQCDADILGYLNSDDRFAPGALDFVLEYFERHPDVDVVLGAVRIINAGGRGRSRRRVSWGFSALDFLQGTCLTLQQGTFFRRSAWVKTNGFNVANGTCWDAELLVDLALTGARFRTVFKVLGEFRVHAQSITGSKRLRHQYLMDRERIRGKLLLAGLHPASKLALMVKHAAFRANPVRRVLEWTVR